ncbi:hypothetical protein BK675_10910 [Pseudomonas fluorescens]|uniref:DUF1508 domain-containing protein n=1 Tax=Pseudomonas fluorescens TaxID=294 RepID=A0A423M2X4_PSEFL|nr:YegP family protein [Pseudomonas fluorescens]RON75820.1 hypothetical protein BK677_01560 [Pseudomonas fluorescens]ROO08491.1 hypothetical protein BK675_10910 [Pseudomonas fluorescens]ROO16811.1 hypothetical protein BK676_14255 [Pseudomonas fluorescens]VVO87614.1 hypothetical protein PS896_02150 [Pseudomonas fluorescens]
MRARFEIRWATSDGRYFHLKAPNGEIILFSETYKTLAGCENGIGSCREHAPYDRFYGRFVTKGEQFSFHVRAANNRIVGQSELYDSAHAREAGIAAVKRHAPQADVVDLTK